MRALAVVVVVLAATGVARGEDAAAPPAASTAAAPGAPAQPIAAAAAAAGTLSLDEAIQLALTRNERAAVADLNVVGAEAGVAHARASLLPILQANGQDKIAPFDKAPINTANASVTISQPLFAPSAYPLYDQAKEQLESQRAQSVDDKRTLEFDAARAYMSVLLADAVVQAAQKKLDTARANVADTSAQAKAQLVSTNDVTRAQIDLASSEHELASDQGSLDAAYVNLAFTINSAPGKAVAPSALFDAASRPSSPAEALVAQAVGRRPDLVAKKHAGLAAHHFAREPRMRFLPSLGVSGTATANSNVPTGAHTIDGTATVNATWTIWDAGARAADAESRDAAAEIADLTTTTLERTIDAQVRTSLAQLVSAQQALSAAKDAMIASQKSADETAILYKQGLARAIELVDANEQRFVAEVGYAGAQDAVAQAYLSLRQTVGLEPTGGDLP